MPESNETYKSTKAHCNICIGVKNHLVLFQHKHKWSEDISPDFDIYGDDTYELLQCGGCDSIKLRHKSRCSEDYDENGPVTHTHYYPPAVSRQKPRWFKDIISIGKSKWYSIEEMIDEVYVALQNGSFRLATMGIRAIIETMMIDKVSDNGTFAANLQKLLADGFVSKKQKERLEVILEAGHATIHRDYCPSSKELNNILDICESMIELLYVHEIKAKGLSDKIPPRPPRNKAKNKP